MVGNFKYEWMPGELIGNNEKDKIEDIIEELVVVDQGAPPLVHLGLE